MKARLNPNLKDFWLTKADVKVLKGGRASSKSWDAAGFSIWAGFNYRLKSLCLRQFQNRIDDSVFALLVQTIERFNLEKEFIIQNGKIIAKRTGSTWHFYGFNRHTSEIKSFEGADWCWIEEGQGLTRDQWTIIEPTIRKQGSQCLIVYNPDLTSDFVETFEHDPENGVIVRQINYDENPFLSDTMLRKIKRAREQDYEEYEYVYLGVPRSDDDKVVIKLSWLNAAVDAHIKLGIDVSGQSRLGFDVADDGKDLNSCVISKGILHYHCEHWKGGEDELLKSATRAFGLAVEHGASIDYDSIGVGAGCGPKFSELNDERKLQSLHKIDYKKFVAGGKVINPDEYYISVGQEKVLNKDYFSDSKSQAWWIVADRFRNTYNAVTKGYNYPEDELISLCSNMPHLDSLIKQLSTPYRDFDKAGRVKVESKDKLRDRGVDSPNDADAFVMANAPREHNFMSDLMAMAYGEG